MGRGSRTWSCPRCGRPFPNRNQPHSCGAHSTEGFLAGKSHEARELFEAFVEAVEGLGEVRIDATRSDVAFVARSEFAGASDVTNSGLAGYFVLDHSIESPRLTEVDEVAADRFVHRFSIAEANDIDDELRSWLEESFNQGSRVPKPMRAKAKDKDKEPRGRARRRRRATGKGAQAD